MKAQYSAHALVLALLFLAAAPLARAHCDTLNGPVVEDARLAITKTDMTPVLKWVRSDDEPAIREVFKKTLAVRLASPVAAEVADTHFFETLVRLHRAGEGEPYTGLKTETPEKGVAAADNAIAQRGATELRRDLEAIVRTGIDERLARVLAAQKHASHSVEAGRAYVAAYVDFLHFAERLFAVASVASGTAHEHHE